MGTVEHQTGVLTDRQMRFVTEYLKDCNGKQAAIRAGYSVKTAEVQASRLLSLAKVQQELRARQADIRQKEESVGERIRRRLWEESEDYSEFASHSARIRALEVLAKLYGEFEKDNAQKTDPLKTLLNSLTGNVFGPVTEAARWQLDDADDDNEGAAASPEA